MPSIIRHQRHVNTFNHKPFFPFRYTFIQITQLPLIKGKAESLDDRWHTCRPTPPGIKAERAVKSGVFPLRRQPDRVTRPPPSCFWSGRIISTRSAVSADLSGVLSHPRLLASQWDHSGGGYIMPGSGERRVWRHWRKARSQVPRIRLILNAILYDEENDGQERVLAGSKGLSKTRKLKRNLLVKC